MSNLPWIEKYRPKSIDDIIDSSHKSTTIKNLIAKNEMPHLLLYGLPGCGKTTMALAIARILYGDSYKSYVLELNASDDRGIDIVRNVIPDYAKTKSDKIKFIILDEADAMTTEAQSALRRVIEIYSKNCRFCIICNNIYSILPGIQSRCTLLRFNVLNNENMKQRIEEISKKENLKISEEAIQALIDSNKDFRQMLNVLQCVSSIYENTLLTKELIYKFTGYVPISKVKDIIKFIQNNDFYSAFKYLDNEINENLWSIENLIESMSMIVIQDENFKIEQKKEIIDTFSKIQDRISNGKNNIIHTSMIVCAFK
jgi:replication factor C subunit 3/5